MVIEKNCALKDLKNFKRNIDHRGLSTCSANKNS